MKLLTVRFDDSNDVVIAPGLEVTDHEGAWCVDLGTDVGGATLAMVPFRIMIDRACAVTGDPTPRILAADVEIIDAVPITLRPDSGGDLRALVVLTVIQRSPDARTELEPYPSGVACIGNAFERPMDTQVLVFEKGARTRFRRFQRGGNYGPWHVIEWDGTSLTSSQAAEAES